MHVYIQQHSGWLGDVYTVNWCLKIITWKWGFHIFIYVSPWTDGFWGEWNRASHKDDWVEWPNRAPFWGNVIHECGTNCGILKCCLKFCPCNVFFSPICFLIECPYTFVHCFKWPWHSFFVIVVVFNSRVIWQIGLEEEGGGEDSEWNELCCCLLSCMLIRYWLYLTGKLKCSIL